MSSVAHIASLTILRSNLADLFKVMVHTSHRQRAIIILRLTKRTERTYDGDNIIIGSNVTNTKPAGPVTISNGKTTITGNKIEVRGSVQRPERCRIGVEESITNY